MISTQLAELIFCWRFNLLIELVKGTIAVTVLIIAIVVVLVIYVPEIFNFDEVVIVVINIGSKLKKNNDIIIFYNSNYCF